MDVMRRVRAYVRTMRRGWSSLSCTDGLSEAVAGRVRANQMRAFFGANGLMTAATGLIALVVASIFLVESPQLVAGWLVAMTTFFAAQVRILVRPRQHEARQSVSPRGPALAERAAVMLGLIWGVVPPLFHGIADDEQMFALGVISAGMMCSGAFVLAIIPRAAILFIVLTAVQLGIVLLSAPLSTALPALVVLATVALILSRSAIALGRQSARHIVDQQLIAAAAAEQKRLRDAMRARERRAQALIESRIRAGLERGRPASSQPATNPGDQLR